MNWDLVVSFLAFKQVSYLLPQIPTFIILKIKQRKHNTKTNSLNGIFPENMHLPENKIQQQIRCCQSLFVPINQILTYQIIPECDKGNTRNHTDGHVPGESPDIAGL